MIETVPTARWAPWVGASILVLVATAGTRMLLRSLLPQMQRTGLMKENYAGRPLPRAAGVIPGLVAAAVLLLGHWSLPSAGWPRAKEAAAASVVILGFVLIGFLDDVVGDRSAGGLGGHWDRLVRGDITTGGLKALFGGFVALAAVAPLADTPIIGLLDAFIVAATANGINLFDVRPGRALKVFFLSLGSLLVLLDTHPGWVLIVPAAAAFAAFAPEDLGGRAMMGDAGANGAGALIGVVIVMAGTTLLKGIVAIGLIGLHAATERASLTAFIEHIPLLRRFDEWGRRRP